jgi:hypothetical protein
MSLCSVFWQSLHKTLEGGGNGGSGSVVGGGGDVRGVEEGDGGVDGCVGEVGEHEGEGDEGEGDEGEGDGGAGSCGSYLRILKNKNKITFGLRNFVLNYDIIKILNFVMWNS